MLGSVKQNLLHTLSIFVPKVSVLYLFDYWRKGMGREIILQLRFCFFLLQGERQKLCLFAVFLQ